MELWQSVLSKSACVAVGTDITLATRMGCRKVQLVVARHDLQQQPVHGTIRSLEAFDPKTDTVAAYAKRTELYKDANDMPEARRVATSLNCVEKTTYVTIRNLIHDKPTEKSLKDSYHHCGEALWAQTLGDIRKIQVQQTHATPVQNSIRVCCGVEKPLGTL